MEDVELTWIKKSSNSNISHPFNFHEYFTAIIYIPEKRTLPPLFFIKKAKLLQSISWFLTQKNPTAPRHSSTYYCCFLTAWAHRQEHHYTQLKRQAFFSLMPWKPFNDFTFVACKSKSKLQDSDLIQSCVKGITICLMSAPQLFNMLKMYKKLT